MDRRAIDSSLNRHFAIEVMTVRSDRTPLATGWRPHWGSSFYYYWHTLWATTVQPQHLGAKIIYLILLLLQRSMQFVIKRNRMHKTYKSIAEAFRKTKLC